MYNLLILYFFFVIFYNFKIVLLNLQKRLLGSRSPRYQGNQITSVDPATNQHSQHSQNIRHTQHQQQQHTFVDLTTKHRKSFRSQTIREQKGLGDIILYCLN